jgi:hypothetical protein
MANRPLRLTEWTRRLLVTAARAGLSVPHRCALAEVSPRTYYRWMSKGRRGQEPYQTLLADQIDLAVSRMYHRAMALCEKAGQGTVPFDTTVIVYRTIDPHPRQARTVSGNAAERAAGPETGQARSEAPNQTSNELSDRIIEQIHQAATEAADPACHRITSIRVYKRRIPIAALLFAHLQRLRPGDYLDLEGGIRSHKACQPRPNAHPLPPGRTILFTSHERARKNRRSGEASADAVAPAPQESDTDAPSGPNTAGADGAPPDNSLGAKGGISTGT